MKTMELLFLVVPMVVTIMCGLVLILDSKKTY